MDICYSDTAQDALYALSERLIVRMREVGSRPFFLALSGGGTAQELFRLWTKDFADKIEWDSIRFFWVDERCVSPDDEESNFGHAERLLFRPLSIPYKHIFRIMGEASPMREAVRYGGEVRYEVPLHGSMPRFDCIILGVGGDAHTASIFPCAMQLLTDKRCYVVAKHPVSKQRRITMTGSLILNGASLFVPVIGKEKCAVLKEVLRQSSSGMESPASYILGHALSATVFTDCKAVL